MEVETLARRYQELGCNAEGAVKVPSFLSHTQKTRHKKDMVEEIIFERLVGMFPHNGKKKEKDRLVQFDDFLKVIRFWQVADNTRKLERMFELFDLDDHGLLELNDVRMVLADTQHKYPEAFENIEEAAHILHASMGGTDTQGVTKFMFMKWVEGIPEEDLNLMFSFDIVDPDTVDLESDPLALPRRFSSSEVESSISNYAAAGDQNDKGGPSKVFTELPGHLLLNDAEEQEY